MSVQDVINTLKRMDERQLIQLFEDLEDIQLVRDIANCAGYYIETYREPVKPTVDEQEDWRKEDETRRNNDYKSDNRSPW